MWITNELLFPLILVNQTLFLQMLDIFKARLKAKTSALGVNLSKERITAIADRLHKKFPELTDEADHDTQLDIFDELNPFADIAKEDDRVRTLEAKLPKPADPKPADPKPSDPPKSELDELKELVKGLASTVQTMTAEKQTQSMQQKLAANEKLKAIDAKLYAKWQLPKTDEEIEAFADEVVGTYGHLAATKEEGFAPGQNRQPPTGATGKIDPAVKAFVEKQNATATQK